MSSYLTLVSGQLSSRTVSHITNASEHLFTLLLLECSKQFLLGQLGYSLKWHHSSENFPMSSLLGENYPQPPKISLCVHFQLNSPVQNCSKRTPSSAQICHLRSFQKRFFWNTSSNFYEIYGDRTRISATNISMQK